MAWTKKAVIAGVILVLAAGTTLRLMKKTGTATSQLPPLRGAAPPPEQIRQHNVGRPELQIQAKVLVFGVPALKKIPEATNWCDALNRGGRFWPVTPTNTVFALNSQLAGRSFSGPMRGDTVVFFEASEPGWNQAGGPELLAKNAEGVTVAFLNGRALIVPSGEVAQLHWMP